MFFRMFNVFYAPDGGADEVAGSEEETQKTPTEIMREMQETHNAEVAALKKELADEKAKHAKEVKEILLNGNKGNDGGENEFAANIANIRKKYKG